MANARPAEVSAITEPNISTADEWVRRTEAAKAFLIHLHNFKEEDFYTVSGDDEPCLVGWSKYPAAWIERSGFVADDAIPTGLVLHCPPGVDFTGEPHDENDPIYLLADCEFWASLTDEEMRVLCDAPDQST
ncbi:hypothetical protein [Sagittula sp.]|uniref:hypothetical protein n=1 Tax=Sagittula sp. TaxID=2038081 RepID=UPI003517DC35